jgi:hypothetical protein
VYLNYQLTFVSKPGGPKPGGPSPASGHVCVCANKSMCNVQLHGEVQIDLRVWHSSRALLPK